MKKKSLSFICYLCFLYLCFELVALVVYIIFFGESFSFQKIISSQKKIYSTSSEDYALAQFGHVKVVIHPYQGFVFDKDRNSSKGFKISKFGFLDNQNPILERRSDRVIIGVFGGSVAWWFSHQGAQKLKSELSKLLSFRNKEIIILKLAIGAYKQPQQLTTLSYLLSLGAKFDFIINMDGFNEITLPTLENSGYNINPSFPMNWRILNESILSVKQQVLIGRLAFLRSLKVKLARAFSKFRFSISASLIWSLIDRIIEGKISSIHDIKALNNQSFRVTGPEYVKLPVKNEIYKYSKIWIRSSIAMSKLAEYSDAKYLHFLQPNQYVRDSKSVSEEERKFFQNESYKDLVRIGYPYLFNAGEYIQSRGIKFYDLTQTFKDIKEPIYVDDCCHINKLGNELLAIEVARAIGESN